MILRFPSKTAMISTKGLRMQHGTIEQVKNGADVAAVGTAGISWLKLYPVHELAALVALIYTSLRIVELLFKWLRACYKRKYGAPDSSD